MGTLFDHGRPGREQVFLNWIKRESGSAACSYCGLTKYAGFDFMAHMILDHVDKAEFQLRLSQ